MKLLDEYIHYRYLHKWKCLKCNNEFDATWHYINRVNGESCPHCYGYPTNTSKKEKELFSFIREVLPSDIEIIENAKILEGHRELDIFIPSMNIAFEFDGLHWHSDSFHPNNYHVLKTDECNRNGIRLIHIFEDEWDFKADIVKGRIKQILNSNTSNKIYARKCIIGEIDKKTKDAFLLKYHLQSYDVAPSVMLGAFYNNELVSVMTFTHGSISKGIKTQDKLVWELNRFCTNYNYNVIGIASKMLTYFKRNYEWKEIFSYADRRWSIGNLYEKLGFEFVKNTGINYWIIISGMRKHRFNIQENNNHEKIYDCGSIKYVLVNDK